MAKWIMILGVFLLALGATLQFAPWMLNWVGKLPGDINIETARGKIYIPITSMLIVSALVSILINLFRR